MSERVKVFRIDDVSVNTDVRGLHGIVQMIKGCVPNAKVMMAFSPLVHDVSGEDARDHERAFPRKLSAMSDHRMMFRVGKLGVPSCASMADIVASHGLVHVDHRLMGREAQELSIVTSCSLLATEIFVPPFNKYDDDTIDVCREHGLELICFEDGWRHINYNKFDREHDLYYMHTHDIDLEKLARWFEQ